TGYSTASPNVTHAFRWTQLSGMTDLGMPPGTTGTVGLGISGDGGAVVGYASVPSALVATYWSNSTGMVVLRDLWVKSYGLDLRGWCLTRAYGISADGRVIVGEGTNPAGSSEGWIARLGAPLDSPACDGDWNRDGFVN